MKTFKFELDQPVDLIGSTETGKVIARSENLSGEDQYLIRYVAGDGRLTEQWWGESAIVAVPTAVAQAA